MLNLLYKGCFFFRIFCAAASAGKEPQAWIDGGIPAGFRGNEGFCDRGSDISCCPELPKRKGPGEQLLA
jgi:hypothetical protein